MDSSAWPRSKPAGAARGAARGRGGQGTRSARQPPGPGFDCRVGVPDCHESHLTCRSIRYGLGQLQQPRRPRHAARSAKKATNNSPAAAAAPPPPQQQQQHLSHPTRSSSTSPTQAAAAAAAAAHPPVRRPRWRRCVSARRPAARRCPGGAPRRLAPSAPRGCRCGCSLQDRGRGRAGAGGKMKRGEVPGWAGRAGQRPGLLAAACQCSGEGTCADGRSSNAAPASGLPCPALPCPALPLGLPLSPVREPHPLSLLL